MPRKSTRGAHGGGSIRKRPDGRWEGRVTIGRDPGTGKQIQRSVYGDTQADVQRQLRQLAQAVDDGTYIEPSKLTVGQWAEIWLEDYTGDLKPGTLVHYKRFVKNYILPYMGATPLSALAPHTVQGVYNRLQRGTRGAPQLAPKSIHNLHGILHRLMQQAADLKYIPENPIDKCKPPRAEKPEMHVLDEAQIAAFLAAIQDHPFAPLYFTDLFTGMRQSELLGLTWDCVDFKRGTVLVRRQLQLIEGEYVWGSPKNDKPRVIEPAPFVLTALQALKTRQKEWRLRAGVAWAGDDFVFTDTIGNHLARQTVYKAFKNIVRSLGMPDVRFHDLRHSYAVAAIRAGDDIKTVQATLGHYSAAFTLDQYGHVTDQMRKDSAARMEAFYRGLPGSKG